MALARSRRLGLDKIGLSMEEKQAKALCLSAPNRSSLNAVLAGFFGQNGYANGDGICYNLEHRCKIDRSGDGH